MLQEKTWRWMGNTRPKLNSQKKIVKETPLSGAAKYNTPVFLYNTGMDQHEMWTFQMTLHVFSCWNTSWHFTVCWGWTVTRLLADFVPSQCILLLVEQTFWCWRRFYLQFFSFLNIFVPRPWETDISMT